MPTCCQKKVKRLNIFTALAGQYCGCDTSSDRNMCISVLIAIPQEDGHFMEVSDILSDTLSFLSITACSKSARDGFSQKSGTPSLCGWSNDCYDCARLWSRSLLSAYQPFIADVHGLLARIKLWSVLCRPVLRKSEFRRTFSGWCWTGLKLRVATIWKVSIAPHVQICLLCV